MLAGHAYVVAVPEVYHEFEAAGTVLAYDQAGADTGNAHKYGKELKSYDSDARALLDHLRSRADCTGKIGVVGICLGGHLAFRTAMNSDATDIHSGSLGKGKNNDSLARGRNQGRTSACLGTPGSTCSTGRPEPDQGTAGRGRGQLPMA